MGGKRKRQNPANANSYSNNVGADNPSKRVCLNSNCAESAKERGQRSFEHPVLSLHFPKLFTLREYLAETVSALPHGLRLLKKLKAVDASSDKELCALLDSAIVALPRDNGEQHDVNREIADATQRSTGSDQSAPGGPQSEVVDLALSILFARSVRASRGSRDAIFPGKPNNILGLGYYMVHTQNRESLKGGQAGPLGFQVVNKYPNSHVNALKSHLWERLLRVIGEGSMFKLLLDTSIFMRVGEEQDKRMYYQLSGPPISDALNSPTEVVVPESFGRATSTALGKFQGHGPPVKRTAPEIDNPDNPAKVRGGRNKTSADPATLPDKRQTAKQSEKQDEQKSVKKTHGEIVFVKSRRFYAKPAYTARGEILFGLKRFHILNRAVEARHILMYMFPRQHGLHNVFTSVVNKQETTHPFQDYTYREPEIEELKTKRDGKDIPVPKRLKGPVLALVMVMQKLHRNCPYHALVKHYCPVSACDPGVPDKHPRLHAPRSSTPPVHPESSGLRTQAKIPSSISVSNVTIPLVTPSNERFTDYASSAGEVSGFVKAAIKRVIPNDFFGSSENKQVVLRMVDRFIKLRRFESFSLHEVLQGLKLTDFAWLRLSSIWPDAKLSKADESKRRELLAEFIYWLFDSFVLPLLRTNFYITESGVDKNRIFYFRHDVWKKLSEPALDMLKLKMFQQLKQEFAEQRMRQRKMGFSTVRLLPKENGFRPLMNLRKRGVIMENGKRRLTPSVNTAIAPVYSVLVFEKSRNPSQLGASMFSVEDMYPRLSTFKAHLAAKGMTSRRLYFAKVDVQACFDTIPQSALLQLIRRVLVEDDYRIAKFVEVTPPALGAPRPYRKFAAEAMPGDELEDFSALIAQLNERGRRFKRSTVLVDDVIARPWETEQLLDLLEMHVRENTVKFGKKYYKQKVGIPQGSVLSSILCNFFYAELEREKLAFLFTDGDSLMLRLIDDFLLVTLSRDKATRFLNIMHAGNPEYGATVNPDKSLVNFETTVHGRKIPRLVGTREFPYCGTVIDTKTLEVGKDWERNGRLNIADTLTVSTHCRPGDTLRKKVSDSFKIHAKRLYFSTSLNGVSTVVRNLQAAFVECGMKLHRYVRTMTRRRRYVADALLRRAVQELLSTASDVLRKEGVSRKEVVWIGARALRRVLARKQSAYRPLLAWLGHVERKEGRRPAKLRGCGWEEFRGMRY